MIKAKITVDGQSRWLNALCYEYFYPVYPDKDFYKAFLQKNFPYESIDAYSTQSFYHREVPIITPTREDLEIAFNCKKTAQALYPTSPVKTSNFGFDFGFDEPPTDKNQYYKALARERCQRKLDRGLNPNDCGLYDMLLRPSELNDARINSSLAGGLFVIEFDSSDDDECFMEWLTLGTKKEGHFEIYKGDDPHFMKIEFWDCYCVGLQESMQQGNRPMQMSLRLSPAITRNRKVVEHEKSWKTSNIHQKWKPVAISEPIEQEEKKVLVEKVEGEAESFTGQTITYSITQYSEIPSAEDKKNVKWELKIDGISKPIKETGESVKIRVEKDWAGKTIIVMPYLNKPTEDISVKTKVVTWDLPRVLTETAQKEGLEVDGKRARDMHVGYYNTTTRKLIHTDEEFSIEKIKNDYVRDKIFKEEIYLSDNELFSRFEKLIKATSIGALERNNLAMLDKFRQVKTTSPLNNKGFIDTYSNSILTEEVFDHPNTVEFIRRINEQFQTIITRERGNINKVDLSEKIDYDHRPRFSTPLDPHDPLAIVDNGNYDILKGLMIAINDTWGFRVTATDYDLASDPNSYQAKMQVKIFDGFGLDIEDIDKFGHLDKHKNKTLLFPLLFPRATRATIATRDLIKIAGEGFRAWFILQHFKGYRPFITEMEKTLTFQGSI
jgi:hypothetical protein